MQHTTIRALIPTHAFRRSLYLLSTVLIASPVSGAFAQSLVPDMPSVELHLDALESLRPAAPNFPPPAPPSGMFSSAPASAPASQPFARTQAAAPKPQMIERQVPVDNPQPMQQPTAQAKPVQHAAPMQAAAQPARSVILPAPPPPLSAPIAKKPVEAAAPKPQPKPAAVPAKPVAAPVKPSATAARVPTEVVKPVDAPAALPTLSDVKPTPAAPAVEAAKPALAPLEAAAQKPAPLLDFSKLGAPKPAVQPVAPVAAPPAGRDDVDDVLKSLDAANQKAAPAKSSDAFPTLSPLPELKPVDAALPAPQGASATASEVMVAAPAVTSASPVALPAAAPAPEDEKLKNLANRMNNLFVKDAQTQGIVSDKTSVTGPQQNLPKAPSEAPAPAPVSNASQPKPGSVLDKLAKGAESAPVIPSAVPAAKPAVSAPVVADSKPALPELPALPSVPASKATPEKPKQLSLEEVNKKSPPETMSTSPKPVVVPEASKPVAIQSVKAPVVAPQAATKPAAIEPVALKPLSPAPVIAEKVVAKPAVTKPVEPVQLSAAVPSKAPMDALKPGAVAALPAMPSVASASSSSSIASVDSLASILPPPSKDTKPAVKAMDVTKDTAPAGLPKLPSLADAPALPSSLPPLSALTGEKKSSMDIAMDKDGVRSSALAPLAPATAENTIPSMAKTNSDALPKVTRGEGEAPPAEKKEPVKPVASAAVATPEKPEPAQLASTSVPATPGSATPATVARAVALPADAGKPILSVTFDKDKTDVELDMQTQIAGVADAAKKASSVRVLAYATGTQEEKSAARRISLSRALQVRAKLIDKGVDPMKITVQALGNAGSAPRDAADIIIK